MIYYIFFSLILIGGLFCAYRMSVIDFKRRIIPDVYLFPFLFAGLLLINFFKWPVTMADAVIGGSMGYCLGFVLGFIFEHTKKDLKYPPIGMGDIKLIGAGGIWLGTMGLSLSMIITSIISFIWSKRTKNKYIPFAPFFLGSSFLTFIIIKLLI
ncbi:MAG: A24 family peptidase [Alphaproteobacteria bacterium]|nr:A24 family peptidase [Alphaproteobacteria bacterium]